MVFHFPETGQFFAMNRNDYEQYEAAYPDGVKLDPSYFDDVDSEGNNADNEVEDDVDLASQASSDFVSNPDMEQFTLDMDESTLLANQPNPDNIDESTILADRPSTPPGDEVTNPSPFKRPSNPEPKTPRHVRFAESTTDIPSLRCDDGSDDSDSDNDSSNNSDASDASSLFGTPKPKEELALVPSSPYHIRATADTWTGLEVGPWGDHSYIRSNGTMAVRRDWEINSGVNHGMLQQCEWVDGDLYEDTDPLPCRPDVPDLIITDVDGHEFRPVDSRLYSYWFVYPGENYWHWCHMCESWAEYYAEMDAEDAANAAAAANASLQQPSVEEYANNLLDAIPEDGDDEEHEEYPKNLLDAIPEDDGEYYEEDEEQAYPDGYLNSAAYHESANGEETYTEKYRLETIPEEASSSTPPLGQLEDCPVGPRLLNETFEVYHDNNNDDDDDNESVIEPMDEDLLDRLATAVLQECDLRKINAVVGAAAQQQQQEENNKKADEQSKALPEKKEKELPRWMQDPFYVSHGKSWAELVEEDEEYED